MDILTQVFQTERPNFLLRTVNCMLSCGQRNQQTTAGHMPITPLVKGQSTKTDDYLATLKHGIRIKPEEREEISKRQAFIGAALIFPAILT